MGLTVYGGGGKPEEEKTVTAGTSVIEVLPSSGKVMKKVTVNPTPTESKSVTPTTSELTVTPSVGKHLSQVVVGAVEDVTPEVTAQTPVITQILEGLVGKAHGANITPETVLNGFKGYRGQELVEGVYVPHGAYVWKKLTAEGGDFVDFVVSDQETAYPDGGIQGGYWYEKVKDGIDLLGVCGTTKIVVDTFVPAVDTAINTYLNHSLGTMPKIAIVYAKSTKAYTPALSIIITNASGATPGFVSHYNSSGYFHTLSTSTAMDASQLRLAGLSNSDCHYVAGVEYTLITMA